LARASPTKPTGSPVKVTGSPVKVAGPSGGSVSIKGALNYEDPGTCSFSLLFDMRFIFNCNLHLVPVYDGRGGKLDMTALHRLERDLPRWDGDVSSTISLVGYTANTWVARETLRKQLSLNIQWVVVLAMAPSL